MAIAAAVLSAAAVLLAVASPAAAATHQVQITDSAFGTPVLTVQVGDTVTWNNADDRPHTVTSENGAFDSGNLNEGGSFSFTFAESGTFTYVCAYHPDMRATTVVQPAAAQGTPQPAPAQAPQAPAATQAPAASAAASHVGDHADDGAQPDTAMPSPASIPVVSFLLVGLGLVGLGVGLMPSPKPAAVIGRRPGGGWRR